RRCAWPRAGEAWHPMDGRGRYRRGLLGADALGSRRIGLTKLTIEEFASLQVTSASTLPESRANARGRTPTPHARRVASGLLRDGRHSTKIYLAFLLTDFGRRVARDEMRSRQMPPTLC